MIVGTRTDLAAGTGTDNKRLSDQQVRLYGLQREAPTPALASTASGSITGVITGDVLEVLRQCPPDQLFDVIIADPPYNIGKDFGTNHDSLPLPDYLEWMQEWVMECRQRLATGGLLYVYGFAEILARVAAQYPIDQQRWLQWHYTNKAVASSRFWQRSHESILCLWREGETRPTLEIDEIREPYTNGFLKGAAGKERQNTDSRYSSGGHRTVYHAHPDGAMPRDVIKVPALAGGAGASERWFVCHDCGDDIFHPNELKHHRRHHILKHPTQKPMALTERLIRSRINAVGKRVLVPFAGSGSECVVAQSLGCEFLGIEINPDYVAFAQKWLHRELSGDV